MTIMQVYINPDLKVVEIKQNDVIVTSPVLGNVFNGEATPSNEPARSAGLRFDEWYEGY